LISDFTYYAKSNDRIGIIGPNGSGKTTLLKIFSGILKPSSGSCNIGGTVNIGYFDQENERLDESKTVLGSLQEIAEFIKVGFARDKKITAKELLDRFLFPRNRHHSFVHTLSGGEKKRLSLLRVLMSNPNVLLLDEPTNDFDIDTLSVFEKYLDDFLGVLIIVSHDRAFLDRCVEFIWSFESNGKIKEYPGNYSSYLERKDKERKLEQERKKIISNSENNSPTKTYNQTKERNLNKLSYKEKRELENIEPEIADLENQIEQVSEQLNDANQDYKTYEDLSRKLSEFTLLLEEKTLRWLELSEKE
jgi:ATP-binding cassette subfamily F protein uup